MYIRDASSDTRQNIISEHFSHKYEPTNVVQQSVEFQKNPDPQFCLPQTRLPKQSSSASQSPCPMLQGWVALQQFVNSENIPPLQSPFKFNLLKIMIHW